MFWLYPPFWVLGLAAAGSATSSDSRERESASGWADGKHCPACGELMEDPEVPEPEEYELHHCQRCVKDIERRTLERGAA